MPSDDNARGTELVVARQSVPVDIFSAHPEERRPVVLADANALIADSMRRTRGLFNVMPYLAERGVIHLLTAEHIDDKVYAKLPEACENAHVSLAAATEAYETVHRPLLRLVEVGDLMLHDDRAGAVHLADKEDGPLAQLGVLLAPSLVLTRDPHLLKAGIGERDWANALVVLKELIELDEMVWGTGEALFLTARLAALGLGEFARFLRRSEWALGITLGLALAAGWEFRSRLRSAPRRLKDAGVPVAQRALNGMTDLYERVTDVQDQVGRTLVAPHDVESLEALVARVLVQRHDPLPADQVHARLPYKWREEVETGDVMAVLREQPAFRLIRGRGWTLGYRTVQARPALQSSA